MGSGPGREPPRCVPLRARSIPYGRHPHRRDRVRQRHAGNGTRGGLQCEQVGAHRPRQVAGRRRARTGHFLRRGLAGRGGHRDAEADAVSAPHAPARSCAGGEIPLHRRPLRDDGDRRRGVRVNELAQELAGRGRQTAALIPYSRDESGCGEYPPQAAVQARDATDVQKVLAFSRARKIPVVPRGAGSGKSGGALAERGGIVLSLEKLDRIVEVSRADMVCVVEPGVILEKLQAAVEAEGLFYPPDPNSQAMRSVSPRAPFKLPEDVGGALIVEHDGHGDSVMEELAKSGELCTEAGAREVVAAQDEAQRRRIWETRRMISVALTSIRPHKISEDVAVPRGSLIELIGRVRAIGARYGLPTACYGHAGDGNLHVNLLFGSAEERAKGHKAVEDVLQAAIDLGGTITGEHGVGLAKRAFLAREQSRDVIELQRRLKRAFDPDNLLNPGKILPPV